MTRRILYIHDFRFGLLGENRRICFSVGMPESYFDRFFWDDAFGSPSTHVDILSRASVVDSVPVGSAVSENLDIGFLEPGLKSFLGLLNPLRFKRVIKAVGDADLVVICFPSIIGLWVLGINVFLRQKYAVEIAADENLFLSKPGGRLVTLILRGTFARVVQGASGALYVTRDLARRFPCEGPMLVASNVSVRRFWKRPVQVKSLADTGRVTIGFVGALTKRKGVDILLRALRELRDWKPDIRWKLVLVGGFADFDIEKLIKKLDVDELVDMKGVVQPEIVFDILRGCDIYVQPSRSEGIPRATIEAMAMSLPVISSGLPGFRELIDPSMTLSSPNETSLSERLKLIVQSTTDYNCQASRNYDTAQSFSTDSLLPRRRGFYKKILEG